MTTTKKPKGTLIIIGGRESKDTEGECSILRKVAERAKKSNKCLALLTVATHLPEEVAADYREIFDHFGVQMEVVDVRIREDAFDPRCVRIIEEAGVVFMTGGDQLRISSQIGDSPVFQTMRQLYYNGGTIVGTSAGAAAMSGTMLNGGGNDQTPEASALSMAPGLAFLEDVVVDSHFAERGRIGRLIGAVSQNPRNLGLGIDEDTAVLVEKGEMFTVLGSGGIYVADGSEITYSSLSEKRSSGVLSIHDVKLHILAVGSQYDLRERRPILPQDVEES